MLPFSTPLSAIASGEDLSALLDGIAEIAAPGTPGPLCVYGLDGQLVITSAEGEPLVLSRLDGPPTAVREATWGQIKARWP